MSKNRVWNRGKHNGAGLSKKNPVAPEAASEDQAPAEAVSREEQPNPRIDTVKPMNRSNWVTRPARVKPQNPDQGK
ncbi:hypothetical protein [Paenibacillus sp. MMS20-IR301]|uniref:hypothetical protein n=1 Tax=Paenibacillus sp. MMS20-IR301 TaxID=2895946 RepID=UPI0028E38B50|nr:hypothetical protein [Paenibacillus sp. MMS20-IR301]WNS44745.1 hypothetical protein LOS79_05570 [Paenibacillus sp. MMS20-IR301]